MSIGPLELNVIQFTGNRFTGEILPELAALHARDIIRVVDLVIVLKDADGSVASMEASDLTGEEAAKYGSVIKDVLGLLAPEDIELAAQDMAPNTSAAVLLFEHSWSTVLREAIARAGGTLVTQAMVPPQALEAVAEELAATR